MTTYGYARVSTDGQTLDAQLHQLRVAGAEKVFSEAVSPGCDRAHDRGLWVPGCAFGRRQMGSHDSASTSLVFTEESFRRWACRVGTPVETCTAAVPNRVSAWAHNRVETGSHGGKQLGRACELVRCNAGRVSPGSVAMTERLSFAQISILCAYAFGMAGGQNFGGGLGRSGHGLSPTCLVSS
jgi:hypothetical protein